MKQEREIGEKPGQTIFIAENVSLIKGEQEILRDVNFTVNKGEKIALVGSNGAGKTSLLKSIIGEEVLTTGTILIPKGITYSYVPQSIENFLSQSDNRSILDYFLHSRGLDNIRQQMERLEETFTKSTPLRSDIVLYGNLQQQYQYLGGWTVESEAKSVLAGVGLAKINVNSPMIRLSGGEKTKIFIAQALLSNKDILLLDEPTNHIDQESITWLGNYLKNYKGAVLIISHKPELLDKFVQKVFELSTDHRLKKFTGNYSDYLERKKMISLEQEKIDRKVVNESIKLKKIIDKLRAGSRASMAKDREKKMKRIENGRFFVSKENVIKLKFEIGKQSGLEVLSVKNLVKHFGNVVFDYSKVNFSLKRGEKVGIMGPVGEGKSTLLKMIVGEISPDEGEIEFGIGVDIGYYSQEMENLNSQNTALKEVEEVLPNLPEVKIRTFLGSFLFSGQDVFKKVAVLSYGERSRLSLAKLALRKPNFLVLDEPSNHLDIISKQKVAVALNEFPGTLLLVSHDLQFLKKVGLDKIITLPSGRVEWM